ncbi:hypothetical protein BKG96_00295 [Rodentibacter caecimuris]|uniref:Plasmid recombination enzyme n=1 Tax=Rodentibacter caecimuris TaxID=1796644 RepID=A0A1V3KQQ8_9PAST|nr:MobV family relaxase [Rodentibacter heylii]OOF79941.1 hypothetical protein BKG96_00295 [Rodentibacter heylii]
MKNFIVFRAEKHKSAISLRHSLRHAMREQNTPNADPSKLKENHFFAQKNDGTGTIGGRTVDETMEIYQSKLPQKVRKNAVHCVEFIVSGSPEHLATLSRKEQIAFFAKSAQYIAEKMGGVKNVIHAQIHFDELTPHLTLFVVPIDEKGKLNARKFIGGSKNVMRDMQTEIAEKVGKQFGFERGIAKSKPDSHIQIQDFYKILKNVDQFITNNKFVPSDEFMDKLSKDLLLIMKRDDTEQNIEIVKSEMKSIKKKWDEWAEEKGLATVDNMNYSEMIHLKARTEREYRTYGADADRYRKLQSELNELSPIKKLIEETQDELLKNVKVRGVKGFLGITTPAEIIPQILDTFKRKLDENKEKIDRERDEEQEKIEKEKRLLSEQRLKLEQHFRAGNRAEIERVEAENKRISSQLNNAKKEIEILKNTNKSLDYEIKQNKDYIKIIYDENITLKNKLNEAKNKNLEYEKKINNPEFIKAVYEKNESKRIDEQNAIRERERQEQARKALEQQSMPINPITSRRFRM